jgi:hypothetical protein
MQIMENSFFHSNQSGKRCARFAFTLALALGSYVVPELRAQLLVVPNVLATNDGNSFLTAPAGLGIIRYMLILDASQFGSLAGPSFLTQLALRPDTIPGPAGPRTTTYRIYASTTTRSVAGMSATFADNLGTNNTLVFDGTLTQATENLPGPGNTHQFDIVTPFTTPFLYDPAAGNLLLDIQTPSDDGQSLRWDAANENPENPTSRALRESGSATAPTGSFVASRVYQFTFDAPPRVAIRTSQVEVSWNSQSNLTYQVQYRSDLTTNLWTSLVDCIQSTNSTSRVYDPIVLGQPQRVYRVVLTDCAPQ